VPRPKEPESDGNAEPLGPSIRLYPRVTDLEILLMRCRQGDALSWDALVRRYQAQMYGFALHYLRDHEEARDAAQEIFIKMFRHLNDFRDGQVFLPWMLRLARNCCIDRIRSRKARPQDDPARANGGECASADASPEQTLLEDARRVLLYRALSTLTANSREIVLLKDIQEMRLSEISTRLGLPLGTVKSRSNRARSELAKAVLSLETAGEVMS
jgi:RNA polymerase sigma-70 factor, ECF subfamily